MYGYYQFGKCACVYTSYNIGIPRLKKGRDCYHPIKRLCVYGIIGRDVVPVAPPSKTSAFKWLTTAPTGCIDVFVFFFLFGKIKENSSNRSILRLNYLKMHLAVELTIPEIYNCFDFEMYLARQKSTVNRIEKEKI